PELRDRAARPRRGTRLHGDERKKTIDGRASHLVARELRAQGTPEKSRSAGGDDDRRGLESGVCEEPLLGDATRVYETRVLSPVRGPALDLELVPDEMRKRKVHIVAAKKNVIAHGNPHQVEGPVFLHDGNRAEIRGPTADVDHQDDVARPELLAPLFPTAE